jgi:signal transduction histidine kinase
MTTRSGMAPLSAAPKLPKRGNVDAEQRQYQSAYHSWLAGELLLVALLSAAVALWATNSRLPNTFDLPRLELVLDTSIALAAALVAVLAGIRFSVDTRRADLLLCAGFSVTAFSVFVFEIAPTLGGQPVENPEGWAALITRLVAALLIAASAFVRGQVRIPQRALVTAFGLSMITLLVIWSGARALGQALAGTNSETDPMLPLTIAFSLLAFIYLAALIGFGLRFRSSSEDLDSWLALAATLWLFSTLHFVFKPLLPGGQVALGDFLRLLAFSLLIVGVWRAIRAAEFGRAVSEERARVAREIHDGLAQYLFALSTHLNMLRSGASLEDLLPRLEEAAALAQQEARFAVLALSSAGGSSPFDSALRRYVEFLCADGSIEVDVEIDPGIQLAPDEQIEIFRIVQEGLANVRKHACANWAELKIFERGGQRIVSVRDDGDGFEETSVRAGQGLKNMRQRARSIGAGFSLKSRPGVGTTVEVALRS